MKRRCQAAGYESLQLGTLWFFGPAEFLNLCCAAMEQLLSLDRPLYERIIKQKLMVWYEPEGMKTLFRLFGVPPNFVAWKEQGLIACVVYAHFSAELLDSGPSLADALVGRRTMQGRIESPVREWLVTHAFPSELVECFQAS